MNVKQQGISGYWLKLSAVISMLIDHTSAVILEQIPGLEAPAFFMRIIGRAAFPIYCFLLVEGFYHTRSRAKYAGRLFLFALISQFPFCLAFTEEGIIHFVNLNMMFTLFLCFLILVAREKFPKGWRQNVCIIVLVIFSVYSDWALLAPVFTLWFATCGLTDAQGNVTGDLTAQRRKKLWKVFGNAMLLFGLINLAENVETMSPGLSILRSLGAVCGIFLSAICIIYLYNGQRAKKNRSFSKWFFYIFYPAHLLILGLLRLAQ